MVTPEGQVRLIDLEYVVSTGSQVSIIGTPGYVAPEQFAAHWFGPAPSQQVDLFSLGATISHLASGFDPALVADEPADRTGRERLDVLLTLAGSQMPALRHLMPLVLGLMHDNPDRRWSLKQAREYLAAGTATAAAHRAPVDDRLPAVAVDRLIADGVRHLLRRATPNGSRLWPSGEDGRATDPCNVQHGAAGVLGVLTRAAQVLPDDEVLDGVAMAAGWIDRRLPDIPLILPGLYFGRSGTAWALHDAALLLGDEAMANRAAELAKQVPGQWPNPEICHGTAGAGLAQLHLLASTGDREFERRAVRAADSVLQAGLDRDGRLVWPVPATFDSAMAGQTFYGFAHGAAGIGTFLLYAALATGRQEYLDASLRAGATLAAVAQTDGEAAWWPKDGNQDSTRWRHWCHGSSGVGTFLIRLWTVTGQQRFRDLAAAAAVAVYQSRWNSSNAACHGLAGSGEFLLDLADLTGEQQYRAWAWDLAALMHARHAVRDGLWVLADESRTKVTAAYNTGLGGALGFLLRLRHGGSRWWMPDEFLPGTRPVAPPLRHTDREPAGIQR
jgi:hypothetical protein